MPGAGRGPTLEPGSGARGAEPSEVATGGEEEFDEREKHAREGFDCYSLYKHADNSYEWRLCRIVEKELRYAEDRDMRNLSDKMAREADA